MQSTPIDIATFLLLHLQRIGLVAALLGACALLLLLGGIAGLPVAFIKPNILAAVVGAAAVALCIAFLFTPFDWRGPVLLTLVYCLLLAILPWLPALNSMKSAPVPPERSPSGSASTMSRREAVIDTGVVLAGLSILTVSSASVELLFPESGRALFPYRVPPGAGTPPVPGITPLVTPVSDFYVNSKNLFSPRPLGWDLQVVGDVRTANKYRLSDLQKMPTVNRYVTMECVDNPVGGPLIGTALWTGVPLRHILARAGLTPAAAAAAAAIVMHSADGYSESIPMATALRHDVVLAYGMNGRTLTPDHGCPARVLVPGLYGFKSVKWVTEIEVGSRIQKGLWQSKGWTQAAVVRTTCRIDMVRSSQSSLLVAGVAYAGSRGISGVQVRADHGPWVDAGLIGRPLSGDTWRTWWVHLPRRQASSIEVRAIDGFGVTQTAVATSTYPDGASGYASRSGPF
jgi:DMSO/TMAO reductase YedYZ molybdopterin-dependent catalytic subunit